MRCIIRLCRRLVEDPVDRDIEALRRELDELAADTAEKIETTDDDPLGGPK